MLFKKKKSVPAEDTTLSADANDSEFKKLLADNQFLKFPKVGDLVKGKIIALGHNEVYVDLDGIATGVVRGHEFFDQSSQTTSLAIGQEVEATVMELENENGEIELSFRFAGQQKAWDNLSQLQASGEVTEVEILDANKGGLMIKLFGVSGFLPVSQLSPEKYPRVPGGDKGRILEVLKSYVGKKFPVKVLDAQERDNKLIVSEKAAWEEQQRHVLAKYKIGDTVEGKITATTDFGAFVEFGEKLEGLIHISEIAWQRIDNPADFLQIGQKISAQIIGIEGSKLFLSIKKLQKDPWSDVETKYQVGQTVSGKVLKVNPFGLFVELDPDIHGLAHVSELASQGLTPADIAKPGDTLEFKIISIEPQNHRLGLSLSNDKVQTPKAKTEKKSETKKEKAEIEKTETAVTDEATAETAEAKKHRGRPKKEKKEEAVKSEEPKTEEPIKE